MLVHFWDYIFQIWLTVHSTSLYVVFIFTPSSKTNKLYLLSTCCCLFNQEKTSYLPQLSTPV
jgi:hypothetical protein